MTLTISSLLFLSDRTEISFLGGGGRVGTLSYLFDFVFPVPGKVLGMLQLPNE